MADSRFHDAMAQGYGFTEPTIVLGGPMLDADVLTDVKVQAPLSMMNRHGLVAGATGTGKTKTLQIVAGELSDAGVPCFIADVKGDVTGIAQPGDPTNPKVQEGARVEVEPEQVERALEDLDMLKQLSSNTQNL